MGEDRHSQLERLFAEALERSAEERREFLEQACEGDRELYREVDELLNALDAGGDYFERLADEIAGAASLEIDHAVRPVIEVGPYRTIRPIGQGGMGVVYLAERVDGQFDQRVALKLLHLDLQQPTMRTRFLRERQILARLEHPNIARLLDGGLTEAGRPYFVMEYIVGRSLTQYFEEEDLDLEGRLDLILELVGAVAYLHRNLVVHRDLKPSNILVDGEGRVRLLDFGIAKLLDEEVEVPAATQPMERLLTPAYAAPEQKSGEPVTTATDVFSLGLLLRELLSGSDPRQFQGRSSYRDLETIAHKATRVEPGRRYASAAEFGEDIQRYRRGLPVLARPSTLGYRLGKWVRRHRLETAVGIGLLALLGFGYWREHELREAAERARRAAQQESTRAVAVSDFLEELLSSVDPRRAQGRDVAVGDVLDAAAEHLSGAHPLEGAPAAESQVRLILGRTYASLRNWEAARQQLTQSLLLRGGAESNTLEALEVVEALAAVDYRSGTGDRAEAPLLRVLRQRQEQLGDTAPETLQARGHLANLYWYQGRLEEAEAQDRQTLIAREQILGGDHPDTLGSRNGLAATLFARGHYAEAAEQFVAALEGQRRVLGEQHPDTLRSKSNLAAAYSALGRFREAEPLQREVVEDRARVLGDDAPTVLLSRSNLGITLLHLAQYAESEQILVSTLEGRRQHATVNGALHTQSFLAELFRRTGRLDEARDLLEATLGEMDRAEAPDLGDRQRVQLSLVRVDLDLGRLDAAERRLEALRQELDLDAAPGVETKATLQIAESEIALARGDPRRALALAVSAGSALEADGSGPRPILEEAWVLRFRVEQMLGSLGPEAIERLQRVVDSRAQRLGAEHPETLVASELRNLANGSGG